MRTTTLLQFRILEIHSSIMELLSSLEMNIRTICVSIKRVMIELQILEECAWDNISSLLLMPSMETLKPMELLGSHQSKMIETTLETYSCRDKFSSKELESTLRIQMTWDKFLLWLSDISIPHRLLMAMMVLITIKISALDIGQSLW